MSVDYLACPKCGNRVDEDETGAESPIPLVTKSIGPGGLGGPGHWGGQATFAYCQHCGAVLGIIPPK